MKPYHHNNDAPYQKIRHPANDDLSLTECLIALFYFTDNA